MTAVSSVSFAIVLVSVVWAAYTFLVYPGAIWLLARLRQSRPPLLAAPDFVPRVALVISAYNEEAVIRAKLDNALALDYPAERLAIWVSSDGSTDRTCAIVREFSGADQRVRLMAHAVRRGKTAALLDTVRALPDGTEVVFSNLQIFPINTAK